MLLFKKKTTPARVGTKFRTTGWHPPWTPLDEARRCAVIVFVGLRVWLIRAQDVIGNLPASMSWKGRVGCPLWRELRYGVDFGNLIATVLVHEAL
jgi:hypothetical protein